MNNELEYYQAIFVLNAIKDGWTVSMNIKGDLEFVKASSVDVNNNDYSKKFIETYGSGSRSLTSGKKQ